MRTVRGAVVVAFMAGGSVSLLGTAIAAVTPGSAVCGNGIVEGDEECDDGGTCIGGTNAGTHCTLEDQCMGNGVCIGGPRAEAACRDDGWCPLGKCVRCVPFGGDGCAANCTVETAVPISLVPGQSFGATTDAGTSEATVWNPVLGPVSIALSGTASVLIGKARDGQLPLVLPAPSLRMQGDAQGLACMCAHGVAAKTCGGTVFDLDGVTLSLDCTPGYTSGDSVCAAGGTPPCAFVHGPGNVGSGVIGCAGLEGINISITQDSRGGTPPVRMWSGSGPPGSAIIWTSQAVGQAIGPCTLQPSSFCTDAAPFSARGTLTTSPLVTGTAGAMILNVDQKDGEALCDCEPIVPYGGAVSLTCDLAQCAGPIPVAGHPLGSCDQLQTSSPSLAGLGLAGAMTTLSPDNIITTDLQLAAGSPLPPSCPGDCNSDGMVTVDEVVQLLSIALGQAGVDVCLAGDTDGDRQITVDEVLIAVDAVLKGCS